MFKIVDKTNKKGLVYLMLIGTIFILLVTMIGSANATTYTISTINSTSNINAFLSNEDSKNPSSLVNGDTVIFSEGDYSSLDLNVSKSITLKASGKGTVGSIFIFKNTKVSGFIVNNDFLVEGKFNTINNNTIKGYFDVYGANNLINNNIIKGYSSVSGINNTIKNNNIFKESSIIGGKNKVISNVFKGDVYIGHNNNKIIGNKVSTNHKIIYYGKKNTIKNNKQSYRDLALKNIGKNSKGHVLSVKNVGTKSTVACYITIDNYDKTVYKIKVPALKIRKSTKIIIPKRIISMLKYKYNGKTYYGGYIYLDYFKSRNNDVDLSNNVFQVKQHKKGYILSTSMQ